MHINIYIVDDHPMVIEGMKMLLTDVEGFYVNEIAMDAHTLLDKLAHKQPDIILMDICLPDMSGIDLCKKITAMYDSIKVIAVSSFDQVSIITSMLDAGASGYLMKNATKEEMVASIRSVYNGQKYLSQSVLETLVDAQSSESKKINLTRREKEIIRLLSKGLTTVQIADILFISYLTVETHRRNILRKFDVNNTTSMLHIAAEINLV